MADTHNGGITKREADLLKDYIDTRIEAMDKLRYEGYRAMEQARLDTLKVMEVRLDALNHVKDTIKDFMPRGEYEAKHEGLTVKIDDLRISKAMLEGKASVKAVIGGYAFSAIAIIMALIEMFKK